MVVVVVVREVVVVVVGRQARLALPNARSLGDMGLVCWGYSGGIRWGGLRHQAGGGG